MQNVKLKLEQLLEKQGKTIYRVSVDTGVSYPTVYKMAKKEMKSVDLDILDKICAYLKCTPNDLIPISH